MILCSSCTLVMHTQEEEDNNISLREDILFLLEDLADITLRQLTLSRLIIMLD